MPSAFLRQKQRDYYYRKAKEEDYRSRATYKLFQAVEKFYFIREGDVVIDLGAAPGGWIQASLKIVGENGYVLGVDKKPIENLKASNVETIVGDITSEDIIGIIKDKLRSEADVVLSDVAPNVSGIWEVDHAVQIDLCYNALRIAKSTLKHKGNFFVKVFQGDLFDSFLRDMKHSFRRVEVFRPKATRKRSAEIYILGVGFLR